MKLVKDIFGCADGVVYPQTYGAGADCPPELEAAALEAEALDPAEVAKATEAVDPEKLAGAEDSLGGGETKVMPKAPETKGAPAA